MQKEIAVDGATLRITTAGVTGSVTINAGQASIKWLVQGKGIFSGTISVTLNSATKGSHTLPSPIPGTLNGDSSNLLENGADSAARKDNAGNTFISVTLVNPPALPITTDIDFEVDDPAQDKWLTE